jgi:hypothetical protein
MLVCLPDYIYDQIDALLDRAIAEVPDAASERAHLRSQLIYYFCENDRLPNEIKIQKVDDA